jgi:TPR repeat protein
MQWYRKAAEQSNAAAQNRIGWLFQNGLGVKQDYTEAMQWYRKAADQEFANGQQNVAWLLQNGLGVRQNYAAAMQWYRKAAEQNNAAAQNGIGWLFQNGLGVKQDYVEAMQWYRKAADQGLANGQDNVGWLLQNGLGVRQDYAEAMQWYRKAADQGLATADKNIAEMYRDGLGVRQDSDAALSWYQKAAQQGDADASELIAQLNQPTPTSPGEGSVQSQVEVGQYQASTARQMPRDSGSYYGSNMEWVRRLLSRVSPGTCPSSMSAQDGNPPRVKANECMCDQYVKAAVLHAWAAQCYAQQDHDNTAQQEVSVMMASLQDAQNLCSDHPILTFAPVTPCDTEQIYRCGELSGNIAQYSQRPPPATAPVPEHNQNGAVKPTPPNSSKRLSYWYRAQGGSPEPFFYDPSVPGSATNAKASCEQKSHMTCVSAHGSAAPAL